MAATNYATLIARVRTDGGDTAASNPHFGETPIGLRNGANNVFRLVNPNVVAGSIFLTYGSATIRSAAGFTILDAPSSYIQMTAAPDAGTTNPFFFDYFSQWFVDADYSTMIDSATEEVGGVAGTDPGETFYPAVIKYALSYYWERRSSQFANQYASRVSTADTDPSSPAKAFLALAKSARSAGDALLKKAQTGFDSNLAPASGTITWGISPVTPRT